MPFKKVVLGLAKLHQVRGAHLWRLRFGRVKDRLAGLKPGLAVMIKNDDDEFYNLWLRLVSCTNHGTLCIA